MICEARALVMTALGQVPLDPALFMPYQSNASPLGDCLQAARPNLDRCGGSQRLIAVVPAALGESPLIEALGKELERPATLVRDVDADIVLCYEAQELCIPHVAARIVGDRGDLAQIAFRLHTRIDVNWRNLADT
jgi:hypothetical protein